MSCMGGFMCPSRGSCANYHARNKDEIHERMCSKGELNAYRPIQVRRRAEPEPIQEQPNQIEEPMNRKDQNAAEIAEYARKMDQQRAESRKATGPAAIKAEPDMSKAKRTEIPRPLGKYEVAEVPQTFGRIGEYKVPAGSCAARG